ncbi:hypothetical protein LC612_42085, partial [Nostoc sp. CHAB 5834]|nr:hypothetical protein [Nostoc sp. CHAB 5834]
MPDYGNTGQRREYTRKRSDTIAMLTIPPTFTYLRLQAFKHCIRLNRSQLVDIETLSEQIIHFFTIQLKTSCDNGYTLGDDEILFEQYYLVEKLRSKPFEKRVTLSLLFYHWLDIEMKLNINFSQEIITGLGVDFFQIQQKLSPSLFSAVLQSILPEESPLNLIASARYIRGVEITNNPAITYGIVQIDFHF